MSLQSEVKDRLEIYGDCLKLQRKTGMWLGIVTYACNSRIWEAEARDREFRASVG